MPGGVPELIPRLKIARVVIETPTFKHGAAVSNFRSQSPSLFFMYNGYVCCSINKWLRNYIPVR